ncbi:MAG TPA: prepilin peptidase [Solirubrobacteraceae bacterium]|jgi:leader peptidase (prepilin peptidase)/N-methyltransferase|nr:prepilin peptidase [Solirubrobacteraceae bacterium]
MIADVVLAALLGAAVGSFLNVVAARLPRGESLVHPGSHCPQCGAAIRARHNVPVLGWLALRGRCYDCGHRIPARYPIVEAVTAALFAGVVARQGGWGADVILPLLLVVTLIPVVLIDLDHRLIPNKITLPAAIAGLVVALAVDTSSVPGRLIAAVAAGGAFLAVALAVPGGMGIGDVKLVGVLGLYLAASVLPALFAGVLGGAVAGGAVVAREGVRRGRRATIPFGPFLALGGLVGVFAGPQIIDLYRHGL